MGYKPAAFTMCVCEKESVQEAQTEWDVVCGVPFAPDLGEAGFAGEPLDAARLDYIVES